MLLWDKVVTLLPHVSRPIQYVGQELHAVRKPWHETTVKVGLCFPDAYEVGMSHLGLHLLYSILNAHDDVLAERFYAPFPDMEARMRQHGIPLFSLESHRSAADFDILGFTLQYELSYSNVVNMLALAGIPLEAAQRTDQHPLIIAGGPCSYNPEPLAGICDAFVLGDGEQSLPALIACYRAWKTSGAEKSVLLRELCRLPGVYVPSLYQVQYHPDGRVAAITPSVPDAPERIRKNIVPDLDVIPYLTAPIVPYLQPVHDRLTLEIMRGCARGCRFCQAGFVYRPLRERSPDYLLFLAKSLLSESGYDEVSLSSLSSGDYAQITSLVTAMMDMCEAARVSVALPSMRVKTLTEQMAAVIRRVRKTGFTIAPEAGTQRLRNVINKGISDADILETVEEAFTAGWDLLKLYFMIGLPTETDEDVEGIIDLVHRIRTAAQHLSGKRNAKHRKSSIANLNVSISSFVPKAHTPFQWDRMASRDELRRKQKMLQARIRHHAIQLKWHHTDASYLEGVFARGDRRLHQVLLNAHQLGCKFDGWDEHFRFDSWMQAFAQVGLDPDFYAYRERGEQECLPWEHLETGVSKAYLWEEHVKALQAEGTPPCTPHCRRCGLCHDELGVRQAFETDQTQQKSPASVPPEQSATPSGQKLFRLRVVYSKTGDLRFLSHRDLCRVFQRAIARINAPIAYSQGFHPHPQISFGPALPVGTEGLQECVEFYFTEVREADTVVQHLNATLPEGLKVSNAFPVDLQAPSLSAALTRFVFQVYTPESFRAAGYDLAYFTRCAETFHSQPEYRISPFRNRPEGIDAKQFIAALDVNSGDSGLPWLRMELTTYAQNTMKPEEVLHLVFHIPDEHVLDCRIVRVTSF